jgi:surfeit locus 1 family protein
MSEPAMTERKHWLGVTASALIVFAVLMSLGEWQLQRLAWKEDLLARLSSRIHAPPVPIPSADEWEQLRPDDYDYRHVIVRGIFDHTQEVRIFFGAGQVGHDPVQPGYLVITPLRLDDGHSILINRGFVPLTLEQPQSRPQSLVEGPQTITGLMRGPELRTPFTPADEPHNRLWFTRDPAGIEAALQLRNAAPFSIDADPSTDGSSPPSGGATIMSIPNNHLAYAWTWFGLAATLVGVYATFMWRRFS